MIIYPTFYFSRLSDPIVLSESFGIVLRNPSDEEKEVFEQNINIILSHVHQKEIENLTNIIIEQKDSKTPINSKQTLVERLCADWVLASLTEKIPLKDSMIDYGILCGFVLNSRQLFSSNSFIVDIRNFCPHLFYKFLKKQYHMPNYKIINDIKLITKRASYWDGVIISNPYKIKKYNIVTQKLLQAENSKDLIQKFLNYCVIAEILLVQNPNKSSIKTPIHQQFSNKLTLLRYIMIKRKKGEILHEPLEVQQIFSKIYELRSRIVHGENYLPEKKEIKKYICILHQSIRLSMELQIEDPTFLEFLYKI